MARKLTMELANEIRREYAGGNTQGEIARERKLGVDLIGRVVRGESWNGEGSNWEELFGEGKLNQRTER